MYSANLYATENNTTLGKSFAPNFRGYIANIKTKNYRFNQKLLRVANPNTVLLVFDLFHEIKHWTTVI